MHITKNDGTTINYAEDLDLAILMYNVLEYNSNYSDIKEFYGLFWRWSKITNSDIANTNDFKSFKYTANLLGNTEGENGILRNTTITVLLKYLSIFWRSLNQFLSCIETGKALWFNFSWYWQCWC